MPRPTFTQIRASALFVSGLAGVAYETLVTGADRPTLLILFAAMLGLPLFLKPEAQSVIAPPPPPVLPPAPRDEAPHV